MDFIKKHKLNIGTIILIISMNLIAYKFLPANIATQFTSSGELANFIPKNIFIFFVPVVLIFISFLLSVRTSITKFYPILMNGIFLAVNIFTLFINLSLQ